MSSDGALVPSATLMDVLEILPRDVLRQNVWLHLHSGNSNSLAGRPSLTLGRPFRLVSHSSRRLADQLIRRLHLTCPPDSASDATESQAAFLARQEGLKDLELVTDGEEHVLVAALQRGGATCQRLSVLGLGLASDVGLTSAAGCAIRVCCPRIQTLKLRAQALDSRFFAPFHDCHTLEEVEVFGVVDTGPLHCNDYLSELAAMPSLRSLTLGRSIGRAQLPLLASLTTLTRLGMCGIQCQPWRGGGGGAALGHALGGLTRLVELDLIGFEEEEPGEASTLLSAIVAQLGGLQHLSGLHLTRAHGSRSVALDGAAYAVLCGLPSLTKLSCGNVPDAEKQVGLPDRGALPRLERLILRNTVGPGELAAMLRPLRPLPQLRTVILSVCVDEGLEGDEDEDPEAAAGRQGATAWQAASLLAAAPQLEAVDLSLCSSSDASLSWGTATALLVPLQDRLTELSLHDLPPGAVEGLWPVFCLAPRLVLLHIQGCYVPESCLLLAVGHHLPALASVGVADCDGVTGDTAVAMAAVCVRPIRITWVPALSAEQLRAFEAVAREGVEMCEDEEASEVDTDMGTESTDSTDGTDSSEPDWEPGQELVQQV